MVNEVEEEYLASFKSGVNPLKQIDFVFNFIKEKSPYFDLLTTDKVVQHTLDNKDSIGINRTRFNQIISKLKEDDFIEEKGPDDKKYYNITFKGVIFIGYEQTEYERIKSYLQAKANQKAILYLTLIIAVGTSVAAGYYFYQLNDGGTLIPHPCAAWCILGISIGIGILILVLEHQRGNKTM